MSQIEVDVAASAGMPAPGNLEKDANPSGVQGDPAARLWQRICATARTEHEREPALRTRLQQCVFRFDALAPALAAILARRLACRDLPQAALLPQLRRTFVQGEEASRMAADLRACRDRDPACPHELHVLLNLKGFHALQAYRAAHLLWQAGRDSLAHALASQAALVFAVDIHPAARIGAGVMLDHGTGIVIGETAVVENDVSLLQGVTLGGTGKERGDRHPKIRSGVMIGAGAKVLGNIEVGTMSKVAAGSVVLKPVPPHCTVAGVPARIVRRHLDGCPSQDMDQTL